MRHADRADEIAALALENRDNGVVGFDIAGAEDGFPPSRHATAFTTLAEADFPATVHAGEAAGLESIAEAVHVAHACRIGHGVRLIEDVTHRRARRPAGPARPLDPRPAHPARAVPVVERADGRRRVGGRPTP